MNILFIHSQKDSFSKDKPLSAQTAMQFGISYIASFLKHQGHETKLVVLTKRSDFNVLDRVLKEYLPALICFTSVCSEYKFISSIAGYIKSSCPEIYLLAGGPHISLNPEDCLSAPFDALCIGEGEEATLELIDQLKQKKSPAKIRNLWIKSEGKVEKNPTRPFLADLDILPFPDRGMWQEWISDRQSAWPILLGRGCPFGCTYCCNHALRKLAAGRYVRNRSIDNVLLELKEITAKHQEVKRIYFEIETFGVKIDWAIEFCKKLENFNAKITAPLSFGVNLRITPKMQLEALFSAMKKANFDYVNIGLESGSEKVRKAALQRSYANKDLLAAVNLAKQHGLKVSLYVMVGIPGETLADFKETIQVTRLCLPEYYELFIFYPYPGTELYRVAKQSGLWRQALYEEKERSRATLDLPGFTKKQILSNYIWFEYHIYKGHKPLIQILTVVLRNKIYTSPWSYSIFTRLAANKSFLHYAVKIKNLLIARKMS
ncbi:MAG: B12-binding domain-containing radical SAM protein [Elusimicrobia bacterium]|nr:B12-binding domain-containing radical SAM protein [Elusimicrobiota bacterium]